MPMDIDYKELIPVALRAMYSDEQYRVQVQVQLDAYGRESYQREKYRVILGVLYLTSQEQDKLSSFIELACTDYRDLLCAAEYPHSSGCGRLKDKDPEKYRKLQVKEEKEYLSWVQSIKQA